MRKFGAILGALAVFAFGFAGAHAQTVVDAKNRAVGTLYGQDARKQYVVRRISSSIAIAFAIVRDGIVALPDEAEYLFASADCAGPAYLSSGVDVLIQKAIFYPSNHEDELSTSGRMIYGGTPRVRLAIYSVRTVYTHDISGDPCRPVEGLMMTVRPVVEQDIATWRLTAPFRLK
jgi:hypothetical protein